MDGSKHMEKKKGFTSLIIRKIQINTPVRYQYIPIGMASMKNKN